MPELLLLLLVLVVAVVLAGLLRRSLLQRGGGAVALFLRVRPGAASGGWVPAIGRFVDGELQCFRVFSLWPGPRLALSRSQLRVESRRVPAGAELRTLHAGEVVLCCRSGQRLIELAVDPGAVPGFSAWLESRPPGLAS